MSEVQAAWHSFCERMAALVDEDFSDESAAYVASQLACWLTYSLGYSDPCHPAFFRSSDLVFRWGGGNVDQVARRAAVSGDGTYRIAGNMGACEEFVKRKRIPFHLGRIRVSV